MINLNWAKQMVVESLRGKDIKCALMTGYVEDPTELTWTQIQASEAVGDGYPLGGVTAVLDVVVDADALAVNIVSAPIAFGLLGVSFANAVVFYEDAPIPRLIAVDVFEEGGIAIDGTAFTYSPANGVVLSLAVNDELIIEP